LTYGERTGGERKGTKRSQQLSQIKRRQAS
jgi:hypothetical protein